MLTAVESLAPPGSSGVARSEEKASVFASTSFALAMARFRASYRKPRWQKWFVRAWRAIPPLLRLVVCHDNVDGFNSVLQWIQEPSATSGIYLLASHSGLYIGKANVRRAHLSGGDTWRRGLSMMFTEHLAGLLFPSSRHGVLPRYKLLRKSIGSVVMLPLMDFVNESQALAVERHSYPPP